MFRMLSILIAILFPTLAAAQTDNKDWWTGTFVVEGFDPRGCHEMNDSRVTYSRSSSEYWELSCSIQRVEPLAGMDGVIVDERCEGMDGDPVEFRRVLLMSQTHESHMRETGGLYRYPHMVSLERCPSERR